MKKRKLAAVLLLFLVILAAMVLGVALKGFDEARSTDTWIPDIEPGRVISRTDTGNIVVLPGPGFTVKVTGDGHVRVIAESGENIINALVYLGTSDLTNQKIGLDEAKALLINDTTVVITGTGLNESIVSVKLVAHFATSVLDIFVTTSYIHDTEVAREALMAYLNMPVSEVFKKNRTMDKDCLCPEYWLQHQGVRFGTGGQQALIYQTPGISSLQLDTQKSLLLINLEYCFDHPYIYIPYQADNGSRWKDLSAALYPAGSVRRDSVSFHLGEIPTVVPRLMMLPNGYLAGYVFTEHADGSNIATHRAVYFGCDTVSLAENASGGFYGNRIPTTKSVFYLNNGDTNCLAINNIPYDGRYLDFLLQLQSTGLYDICLHTPEDMNSDRSTVEQASQFMNEYFSTVSWIDHGMFGGKYNRECFQADGLNPDSSYYCSDIWKKYGVKYFWNSGYELLDPLTPTIRTDLIHLRFREASLKFWIHYLTSDELRRMSFLSGSYKALRMFISRRDLYLLDRGRDEAFPVPVYWMNPTRTGSFYSWGTHYVSTYNDLSTSKAGRQVERERHQIDDLIDNQAIFINHGYFVRGIPNVDLTIEKDGRVILNPYFEKILRYMAGKRDEGDLMITTIKDLLDYLIQTERIEFQYSRNGDVEVINNNNSCVRGLAMSARNSDVLVDGKIPASRVHGEDRIFWFDIQAHDTLTLKLSPVSQLAKPFADDKMVR
jgi:hypothetical protein